jgi:hypothetical protein
MHPANKLTGIVKHLLHTVWIFGISSIQVDNVKKPTKILTEDMLCSRNKKKSLLQ